MKVTNEAFNNCPIGQLFSELSGSAHTIIRAIKVSSTDIKICTDETSGGTATVEIKPFNEEFDFLMKEEKFINIKGEEYSFDEFVEKRL